MIWRFAPLYHFAPCIILPLYHFAPPPWKSFNDLRYLPMSRIILPPGFILPPPPIILPPGNLLMYTIFPFPYHFAPISFCPPPPPPLEIVSWFTLFTHVHYHFAPWTHFAPISFCPLSFCPPENGLMIYTIFHVPYHFAPCIRLRFRTNKKPFTTKAYDRRASGDCGTSGLSNATVP